MSPRSGVSFTLATSFLACLLACSSDPPGPGATPGGAGSGPGATAGTPATSVGGSAATPAGNGGSPGSGTSAGGSTAGDTSNPIGGSATTTTGGESTTGGSAPIGSELTKPQGKLPNSPYTGKENLAKGDWAKGLISPTLLDKHHIGQSSVVNGYLVVAGNEEFWIFDLSDPTKPKQLSEMLTPNRDPKAGPKAEGEAESHTVSFSRRNGHFYMVKNGATGQAVTSRIGVSFSDNIELATVHAGSFMVRPVGGQPLAGSWGLRMGVVNFDPDMPLAAGTTYEVVLPQGGVTDLVGNALAQEFKSTFTTK